MKMVGIIFIVLSSTMIGLLMASNMSGKVRRIEGLIAMLEEMASRLAHLRPTMLGLMTWLAARERFAELGIAEVCRQRLQSGEAFSISWRAGIECESNNIDRDLVDILSPLGEVLGSTDLDSQLSAISCACRLLKVNLETAREEQRKKSGMFRTMGVLCGIAIAILLI